MLCVLFHLPFIFACAPSSCFQWPISGSNLGYMNIDLAEIQGFNSVCNGFQRVKSISEKRVKASDCQKSVFLILWVRKTGIINTSTFMELAPWYICRLPDELEFICYVIVVRYIHCNNNVSNEFPFTDTKFNSIQFIKQEMADYQVQFQPTQASCSYLHPEKSSTQDLHDSRSNVSFFFFFRLLLLLLLLLLVRLFLLLLFFFFLLGFLLIIPL